MADAHADHGGGGEWLGITIEIVVIIAILAAIVFGFGLPFTPTYLNIDYVFGKMLVIFQSLLGFFINYNTGATIKTIVGVIIAGLVALDFYLFLRILEMEDEHAEHVYHHAEDDEKPKNLLNHVISDVKELGRDIVGAGHNAAEGSTNAFDRLMYWNDEDIVDKTSETPDATFRHEVDEKEGSSKWRMVLKHSASKNPSDWKLAIIEADTILDALVERSGFPGATLGERLKNADRGVFRNLDFAWEAHKVRNRIAHEGSNFDLTERDAKNTIRQYEEVFKEFGYI